jgi:hypothetical protein
MTRSINMHPASLAVGFILAVACMVSLAQTSLPHDVWPPAKSDIVNIYSTTGTPVAPGGYLSVYTVPSNRWLTVTGAFEGSGANLGSLLWAESYNSVVTPKGDCGTAGNSLDRTPAGSGGAVGWTFRPGSQVVLMNSTGAQANVWPTLIGYLSNQ